DLQVALGLQERSDRLAQQRLVVGDDDLHAVTRLPTLMRGRDLWVGRTARPPLAGPEGTNVGGRSAARLRSAGTIEGLILIHLGNSGSRALCLYRASHDEPVRRPLPIVFIRRDAGLREAAPRKVPGRRSRLDATIAGSAVISSFSR